MYSFYGGRPGNSFIIITTYRSVQDMIDRFSQGPEYNAVHYGEYVMINTVNKNDPDNGKLYRRGYEFTNENGGAEFIGSIVGPAGEAPALALTTIEDAKHKHEQEGYDERTSEGELTLANGSLIPGKEVVDEEEVFNDRIKYYTCSIRTPDHQVSTAYIGVTFPYVVIDYTTTPVSPYKLGRYEDRVSTTRIDNQKHPFYEKWNINIPRGIKGDSAKNLRVKIADSHIDEYEGQEDDIENQRKVLVYDYYNYETFEDGDRKYKYIGDYNMIKDFTVDGEGTVEISYTHDDADKWVKLIKWIKNVTLDKDTGEFKITFNHLTDKNGRYTTYQTYLDWVDNIEVAQDGTITFHYTNSGDTTGQYKIKWISSVQLRNDGYLIIHWNDGSSSQLNNRLKWPIDIRINSNQKMEVQWSNGTIDQIGDPIPVYDYNDGDSVSNLSWIGIGQIIDDGINNKKIKFNITPLGLLNPSINTITLTSGTLKGSNGTDTINLDMSGQDVTNITKTFTGFEFEVDSGIAGSAASSNFINLSIENIALSFSEV